MGIKVRGFVKETLATVMAGILLIAGVVIPFNAWAGDYVLRDADGVQDLTEQDWKDVANCTLRYHGSSNPDWVDAQLCGQPVMDPSADDDGDGLLNSDELKVETVNGTRQLVYLSHPKLNDTDGDGYLDNVDKNKLTWDLSPRDTVLFMELSYRNAQYVAGLLEYPINRNYPYAQNKNGVPRTDQMLIQAELAPYWDVVYADTTRPSGFDAYIFQFSNKALPFLDNGGTTVVAFRGTGGDGGDDTDIGADGKLATGIWPDQAQDAKNLAQKVFEKGYRNVTFTGHSLGGFLAQIAYIWSRGGYYYPDNTGPGLGQNPNVVGLKTFNAPIIVRGADNRMKAYGNIDYDVFERGGESVKLYATNNDPVISMVGRAEPTTYIGRSDGGHSSSSFFEDKFKKFFSTGARRTGMETNDGSHSAVPGMDKQDPSNRLLAYDIILSGKDGNNKVLKSVRTVLPKKDIESKTDVMLVQQFDSNYVCTNCLTRPLEPNKTTKLLVQPEKRQVLYRFIDQANPSQPVEEITINTVYQGTYNAPEVPKHTKALYSWQTANGKPVPVVAGDKLTKAVTVVEVPLKEVPPTVTTVQFYDKESGGNIGQPVEIKRAADDKSAVTLADVAAPSGYELTQPAQTTLQAGKTNRVPVQLRRHRITYAFVFEGTPVGSKEVPAKHGQAAPIPQAPYGYIVPQSEKAKQVDSVTEDKTVEISVAKQSFTVSYRFVDIDTNNPVGQGGSVQSPYLDSVAAPAVPTGWELVDPAANGAVPSVTADSQVDIQVRRKTFGVTFNFVLNGQSVGKRTVEVAYEGAAEVPTPPANYMLKAGEAATKRIASVTASQTVDVDVVSTQVSVKYQFVYQGTALGAAIAVGTTYGGDAPLPEAPQGYKLKAGEEDKKATHVTGAEEVIKLQVDKLDYSITYIFTENGKDLGKGTVVTAKYQEAAALPTLPAGYQLADGGQGKQVSSATENTVVRVPVVKKTFIVTYRYMLDAKEVGTGTDSVRYGEDSTYRLAVPNGYELADGYQFAAERNVVKAVTVDIPVVRQVKTITISYRVNGTVVHSEKQQVAVGDKPGIVVPSYPRPAEKKRYELEDGWNEQPIAADTTEYPVPLKVVDIPATYYSVQVAYRNSETKDIVGTELQSVEAGKAVAVNMPELEGGHFELVKAAESLKPSGNGQFIVDIKPVWDEYEVTLLYVIPEKQMSRSQGGKVVKKDVQKVSYNASPVVVTSWHDDAAGGTYTVSDSWVPPIIAGPLTVWVPVAFQADSKPGTGSGTEPGTATKPGQPATSDSGTSVSHPARKPSMSSLAVTGAQSLGLIAIALICTAVGAATVMVRRRQAR